METVCKIFRTSNYKKFKTLLGNRDVPKSKTARLVKSIRANGYIFNPISVNENFEIIDGQGRFSALKELGFPIDYYVVPNANIKECIVLNLNTQNWTHYDYIKSFAEQGNINYQRLLCLLKIYNSERLVVFINSLYSDCPADYSSIVNGDVIISETAYDKINNCLEFIKNLDPVLKNVKGRKIAFEKSIAYAFYLNSTNKHRLYKQLIKYSHVISPIVSLEQSLREITAIYNKRMRKDFLYFDAEYDNYSRIKKAKYQAENRKRR